MICVIHALTSFGWLTALQTVLNTFQWRWMPSQEYLSPSPSPSSAPTIGHHWWHDKLILTMMTPWTTNLLLDMVVVIENYAHWSGSDWIRRLDGIRFKERNLSVKETKRRREEKKRRKKRFCYKNGQWNMFLDSRNFYRCTSFSISLYFFLFLPPLSFSFYLFLFSLFLSKRVEKREGRIKKKIKK